MTSSGTPGRAPVLRASEKSLLHLLRMRGALSKAELARLSNMSAQGVSIIVERLLDLDLVRKGEKMRGRVGQPSTPIILNPEGAISLGICIDSHEAQIVVSDFQGVVRGESAVRYNRAQDDATPQRIIEAAMKLPEQIGSKHWKRRVGIGIAADETLLEFFTHSNGEVAIPATKPSLARRLEDQFNVPAYGINDIRAACVAELAIASGFSSMTTLYFHLGASMGTGIILEGRLIGSEDRRSSALHSLPLVGHKDLYVGDLASLAPLQRHIGEDGHDFAAQVTNDFSDTQAIFKHWQAGAIMALTTAIHAASATFNIDRVLLAGGLSKAVLSGFAREVRYAMEFNGDSRIQLPEVSIDTVTPFPRAQGAAMMPFLKVFGVPDTGDFAQGGQRSVA